MPQGDAVSIEMDRQLAEAKRNIERLFPAAQVSAQVEDDVVKVTVLLDDEAMAAASTEQGLERLLDVMGRRRG